MTTRCAIGFAPILTAILFGSLSCRPAVPPVNRVAPAPLSAAAPSLPPRATVSWKNLQPPVTRPTPKPYPRSLPAGVEATVRQAKEFLKRKEYAAAVEKFRQALESDPENPSLRYQLGMSQLSLPDYNEALKNLHKAAEYLGDDVHLQILLGQLYQNLRRNDEALYHFRIALTCSNAQPSHPQAAYALLSLANLLEREGYWTAALECLTTLDQWRRRHSREYESNPLLENMLFRPERLQAVRGRLLARLGRRTEAIELLANAHHRNRADAQTAAWLFEALLEEKQYRQAEQMLVDLAGNSPLAGMAPALAGKLCAVSGDRTAPRRLWRTLRAAGKTTSPLAMGLARSARAAGDALQAAEILDEWISESPDSTDAIRMLVELSAETGDRLKALRLLARLVRNHSQSPESIAAGIRTIVRRRPPDPHLLETFSREAYQDTTDAKYSLHYVAGLLAREENKPLQAADHFQRAVREKKDFYPAYEALLDLHLRTKDVEATRTLLELCREVAEKEYYYNYLLGRARLSEGKPDQAVDALEAARRKNPSHAPTLLLLAKAYRMQADFSADPDAQNLLRTRAETAFQQTIRLAPDAVEAYRSLFDLYLEQNEFAKALELAETFRHRRPDQPDGGLMQAEALLHVGQIDQARAVLRLLRKRFPDNPAVQLLALQAVLRPFRGVLPQPVFDQTVRRLEAFLKQHPDHDKTQRFLAQLLSQPVPGRFDQAVRVWDEIARRAPDDLSAAQSLAAACLQAGQYDRALKVLRTLRKAQPDNATLRLMEADALVKSSRHEAAARKVRRWWERDKTNAVWATLLLDLYEETGQYDLALQYLDELKSRSPDLLPKITLASRAVTFLCRAGRYRPAVAEAMAGKETILFSLLTDELTRANQTDLLCDALQTALAKQSDTEKQTRLRELLLYALSRAERIDPAVALADGWVKELQQAESRPAATLRRAAHWREAAVRILLSAGRINEAEKRLQKYLAEDPNNAELHNLRSSLLTEQGQPAAAEQAIRRALALQPKAPSYQNNLAYLLAESGKNLAQAETLARSVLQTDGPRTTTADTLAWVYYKQGRLGEAAEIFASILPDEEADLSCRPRKSRNEDLHPIIYDHAGDAFYRLGWIEQAVRCWREALRTARKEPFATREIRGILQHTPTKLQAVSDRTLAPVAPMGEEVESAVRRKTLPPRAASPANLPAPESRPALPKR